MRMFFTYLFAFYFFASSAFLVSINTVICLLVAPFDPLRRAVHMFASGWGQHYFWLNPLWKLNFRGVEQIKRGKTYVLVANHQSLFDILILYGLYRTYKWVSKEEVAKTPFIGWNMRLNQYIFIKRGDMKSIKEMMQECREWLKKGSSIMIFPEGTRSEDGRLQPFRDGAFKLAIEGNYEIIPIVLNGTFEIFGKASKAIRFKQNVDINVLAPIDPAQFDKSSGKLRAYVHEVMAKELARLRGKRPEEVVTKGIAKAVKSSDSGATIDLQSAEKVTPSPK